MRSAVLIQSSVILVPDNCIKMPKKEKTEACDGPFKKHAIPVVYLFGSNQDFPKISEVCSSG